MRDPGWPSGDIHHANFPSPSYGLANRSPITCLRYTQTLDHCGAAGHGAGVMFPGNAGAFGPSVPAIDAQHESARFSVPIIARRNADGLIIDAVKNIVDAQRRAPVRIDLIAGAEVDHRVGALHLPKVLLRYQAIAE
jgi:hypothetical protein